LASLSTQLKKVKVKTIALLPLFG